jgi:PAS domain S-box-containing protein
MPQHDNDAIYPVESDLDARIGAVERRITTTVDMLQMQQAIIENLPDAKVVVDDAGRIVVVNRQTELMFGYTRKEMLDQPLEMLLPERFREIHRSHRERYCDDPRTRPMGVASMELWGRRKSGREFRLDIMLAPIVIAAGSFTIAVIRRLRDEPPTSPAGAGA